MAYTNSWSNNTPFGGDPATVDDDLRQLRLDIQERMDDIVDDWTDDPVVPQAKSAVKISRSAADSIASGATENVDWDNEIYDPDDWWAAGDPTKLTVPAGVPSGRPIFVAGAASFATPTDGNLWRASILLNGVAIASFSGIAVGAALIIHVRAAAIIIVDPADYLQLQIINPDSAIRNYTTGEASTHFEAALI